MTRSIHRNDCNDCPYKYTHERAENARAMGNDAEFLSGYDRHFGTAPIERVINPYNGFARMA